MRIRSFLAATVLAAGLFGASGHALAEPSDKCGGAPYATGTDGTNSISVCGDTFAVTASQQGSGGYVAADGDSGNANPSDGYIGVSDQEVVFCEGDGDYTYGTAGTCGM